MKIPELSPIKSVPPSGEVEQHNVTSKCFGKNRSNSNPGSAASWLCDLG